MKKTIIAVAAAALLSACGATGPTHTENDAKAAIAAAEHENSRAAKKNYEWRDTGKIIKKAKAALKEGKFDDAVKQANKAKSQASMALAQYEEQKNAAPRY